MIVAATLNGRRRRVLAEATSTTIGVTSEGLVLAHDPNRAITVTQATVVASEEVEEAVIAVDASASTAKETEEVDSLLRVLTRSRLPQTCTS